MKVVVQILFIISFGLAFSQPNFSRLDTNAFNTIGIVQKDNTLYTTSGYRQNNHTIIQMVKYDVSASSILDQFNFNDTNFIPGGLRLRQTNDLTVFGYSSQLPPNSNGYVESDAQLYICLENNDSICKVEHDFGFFYDVIHDILIDKDTNINLLLSIASPSDSLETVWAQFDRYGNLLQQVPFTEVRSELALNLIETWDGNYMHSYARWRGYPYFSDVEVGIRKFAPDGTEIWDDVLINSDNEGDIYIFPLADKTFLRLRLAVTGNGNGTNPSSANYLRVERIDINGKQLSTYNWSDATNPFFNGFWLNAPPVLNLDGTVTIPLYTSNPSLKGTPRLIKVDPFMNIIWDRIIQIVPDSLPQQFAYISAAPDGGYYLSGFARDTTNKHRSWILKTDCHGEFTDSTNAPTSCMEFDCTQYPIDAFFTASDTLIDLAYETGEVTFTQTSPNATSHIWSFDDSTGYASDTSPVHTFTQSGIYTVTHEVHVGYCDTTFTQNVHVINTLGLKNQPELSGFYLYPNPTNREINLVLPNTELHYITLTALDGKILQEINVTNTQSSLDLSNYAPGLYLLSAANAQGQSSTVRVVKK